MTSRLTRASEALTAAHRAARKVETYDQAVAWVRDHYEPNIENDMLHDELVAMHEAIVQRVYGVGGG